MPGQTIVNKTLAWTTLGACFTTASYLSLKEPAHAEAPAYVGTVQGNLNTGREHYELKTNAGKNRPSNQSCIPRVFKYG